MICQMMGGYDDMENVRWGTRVLGEGLFSLANDGQSFICHIKLFGGTQSTRENVQNQIKQVWMAETSPTTVSRK